MKRVLCKIGNGIMAAILIPLSLVAPVMIVVSIVQFALGQRPPADPRDRCEVIAKQAHHLHPSISERRFYADCSDTVRITHP